MITQSPGAPPYRSALDQICHIADVDPTDAKLLHVLSNVVYLLPRENIVVRMAEANEVNIQRAATAIKVTRWLSTQSDQIALEPTRHTQPVVAAGVVATFWPYCATPTLPSLGNLAAPLRNLHAMPMPPFAVPPYQPLRRLRAALTDDHHRPNSALSANDRTWIESRAQDLIDAFDRTDFPLGVGLIHADAHTGNLLPSLNRTPMTQAESELHWILIDWDQTCLGPRELDLLSGLDDHFHESTTDRLAFLDQYGYDLTAWPNWPLLRDIAELHSLASYVRRSPSNLRVATELAVRVQSLRTGDRAVKWHSISSA